ncbi:hypothetical protein [Nocardioides speluncae]|uniref:phage major capsid protein n=1 Tax=Nocardioides speluncae TaxID=2670337 RepID=UPI000D68DF07|nr:hypothetical protein [Nocardioides speluncae]
MSEFLELLETIRSEDASTQRLFGDAGRGIRSMRKDDPRYQRSLNEAITLVEGVVSGRVPMHRLQEAMSTSDFPLLFGDILDRSMLGTYNEWPSIWRKLAKKGTVRDFRTVKKFFTDGAEAILPAVKQGSEYKEAALSEGKYEYSVGKYGRRLGFLWEAMINDDLDALRDAPQRLAKAARMSEERFATELYADGTGPDAAFFSVGNNNRLTANPLTVAGLQTGITRLKGFKDVDGNPIFTGLVRLEVPPALEITAKNIINATEIRVAAGSGSATTDQLVAKNWMDNEVVELVVNPWLPIVDESANKDNTWYLFADPDVGRPAMEVGFLRGHESPQLFMKAPNAIRIGGGMVGAEEGSFETDGLDYKVRHVFGGSLMEPKAALASIGA